MSGLTNCHDFVVLERGIGWGPPPGTFGLKLLKINGFWLDLWKSYLAGPGLKAKAQPVPGLVDLGLLLV